MSNSSRSEDEEVFHSVFHITKDTTVTPDVPVAFTLVAPSSRLIRPNKKGDGFRLLVGATYRFVFEGEVNSHGAVEPRIIFDLTGIEEKYQLLLQPTISASGFVSRSIIMPCHDRTCLKINFHRAESTSIRAGAQLQIYRVT